MITSYSMALTTRLLSVMENSLEAVGLVYMLLQQLLEHAATELSRTPKGDPGILEILSYMEENFDQELTTELLAERSGYSAAHFCRKFKAVFGMTFQNFLTNCRIEKSSILLIETTLPISEISKICGFTNCSYFSKCFKEIFDVSPLMYRQKFSKKN